MSYRALSKELQQVAIDELSENSEKIGRDLDELQKWIKDQNHLKFHTDKQWLLNLLRGSKYDLDKVKTRIEILCTLKSTAPEYFSNRDPLLSEIQELLDLGLCLPLPKTKNPTAPRVLLGRIITSETTIVLKTLIKLALMILEILIIEDDTFVVAGTHIFVDNEGFSVSHSFQCTPDVIKSVLKFVHEVYSLKLKSIHVINIPWYAEIIYNMFKSFLPAKAQALIYHHSTEDMEELYDDIPLSVLPKEYGGSDYCLEELKNEWKLKVESYRDWFLYNEENSELDSEVPDNAQESSLFGVGWYINKILFSEQ